jgi:RNA polymerase sigma-70 factor, ECF subfamily
VESPVDNSEQSKRATRMVELLTSHQRDLFSYINTLLFGDSAAHDVLQETNLDLWARIGDFDFSRPFLPWAYGFAMQRVLAFRKARRRSRLVFSTDLTKLITDAYIRDTNTADVRLPALRRCLEKLDSSRKDLMRERYLERISVNALALRNGKTANQLSARLYRIRTILAKCIAAALVTEG